MIERENANCGGDAKCHFDGKIVSWHIRGDIWLMVGEPSESNVVVQVGNEGVLVVDTGAEQWRGSWWPRSGSWLSSMRGPERTSLDYQHRLGPHSHRRQRRGLKGRHFHCGWSHRRQRW